MRLILLDDRVEDKQLFLDACKNDVEYIVFNFFEDTYESIKSKKIQDTYESIGIISKNYIDFYYKFLEKEPACQLIEVNLDDNINSWKEFYDFLLCFNTYNVDLMACNIFSSDSWKYIINVFFQNHNVRIRASDDETGNLKNGGDWILESDDINIYDIYFTEIIESYNHLLDYKSSNQLFNIDNTYQNPGRVKAWGNVGYGGDYQTLVGQRNDIVNVVGSKCAFSAINNTKLAGVQISRWGDLGSTGYGVSTRLNFDGLSIKKMVSNDFSFAALSLGATGGTVYTWGYSTSGGYIGSTNFSSFSDKKVIDICSSKSSFAALTASGDVYTWGNEYTGSFGFTGSSAVKILGVTGVVDLIGNDYGFTALDSRKNVYSWGTFNRNDAYIYKKILTVGSTGSTGVSNLTGKTELLSSGTIQYYTNVSGYNITDINYSGNTGDYLYNKNVSSSPLLFNAHESDINIISKYKQLEEILTKKANYDFTYIPEYYTVDIAIKDLYTDISYYTNSVSSLSYFLHNNVGDRENYYMLLKNLNNTDYLVPKDYFKNLDGTYLIYGDNIDNGITGYSGLNAAYGCKGEIITNEVPLPEGFTGCVNFNGRGFYMSSQGNFESLKSVSSYSLSLISGSLVSRNINANSSFNRTCDAAIIEGKNWATKIFDKNSNSMITLLKPVKGTQGNPYTGLTLPSSLTTGSNTWMLSRLGCLIRHILNIDKNKARTIEAIKDSRNIVLSTCIDNIVVIRNASNVIQDGGYVLSEFSRGSSIMSYNIFYTLFLLTIIILLDSQGFKFPFIDIFEGLTLLRNNMYNMAYGSEAVALQTVKKYLDFFYKYDNANLNSFYVEMLKSDEAFKLTAFYTQSIKADNLKDMKIIVSICDYYLSKYVFDKTTKENILVYPEPSIPDIEVQDLLYNMGNLITSLKTPISKGGWNLSAVEIQDDTMLNIISKYTSYRNNLQLMGSSYYDSLRRYISSQGLTPIEFFKEYYNI